jgi:FAD/FMN-containing dehydrogenase
MRGVRVDPVARTAQVEAGVLWTDLIHESQPHGLGGGFGWLGRKYGFNAASMREADVVTLQWTP